MNAENKRRALDLVREIRVRIISIELDETIHDDNAETLGAIRDVTHILDELLLGEPEEEPDYVKHDEKRNKSLKDIVGRQF